MLKLKTLLLAPLIIGGCTSDEASLLNARADQLKAFYAIAEQAPSSLFLAVSLPKETTKPEICSTGPGWETPCKPLVPFKGKLHATFPATRSAWILSPINFRTGQKFQVKGTVASETRQSDLEVVDKKAQSPSASTTAPVEPNQATPSKPKPNTPTVPANSNLPDLLKPVQSKLAFKCDILNTSNTEKESLTALDFTLFSLPHFEAPGGKFVMHDENQTVNDISWVEKSGKKHNYLFTTNRGLIDNAQFALNGIETPGKYAMIDAYELNDKNTLENRIQIQLNTSSGNGELTSWAYFAGIEHQVKCNPAPAKNRGFHDVGIRVAAQGNKLVISEVAAGSMATKLTKREYNEATKKSKEIAVPALTPGTEIAGLYEEFKASDDGNQRLKYFVHHYRSRLMVGKRYGWIRFNIRRPGSSELESIGINAWKQTHE